MNNPCSLYLLILSSMRFVLSLCNPHSVFGHCNPPFLQKHHLVSYLIFMHFLSFSRMQHLAFTCIKFHLPISDCSISVTKPIRILILSTEILEGASLQHGLYRINQHISYFVIQIINTTTNGTDTPCSEHLSSFSESFLAKLRVSFKF